MAGGREGKGDKKGREPKRAAEAEERFVPSGFFALRTPTLPIDELEALGEGLTAAAAPPEELEAALANDRARTRARLRALVERPEVLEALFVASPSLYDSLDEWRQRPDGERGRKVERSLLRYLPRMAARPTPFGLFAGCSIGEIGGATRLELPPRASYARHTRLDMDYLFALAEALPRDPALAERLTFRVNSTLYRAAGRLRYAEARLDGKLRNYHLVAVEPTEYLDASLARARDGANKASLAAALVSPEVTADEAREFVDQLVDEQLLVSDLSPAVTGREPVPELIDRLRALEGCAPAQSAAAVLGEAQSRIEALDAAGLGGAPALYHEVAKLLEPLPTPVELPRLFQVDLYKPVAAASLGPKVVDALLQTVRALHRLARPNDGLASFREAFSRRWEDAEVPLAEALDEESGVGFRASSAPTAEAAPLIDGIVFPSPPLPESAPAGPRQALLLGKLLEATRSGARAISLTDEDLAVMAGPLPPPALPDSFAVMATVLARSAEAIDAGDFRLEVSGASGPSGARLFGRFAHGDARLEELVRAHLAAEEALDPDALFAEVVHLPEGRIGNILLRPVLRGHEIAFLARPAVAPDRVLALDDLTVAVRGGRVELRSRRLGRRVVPRLTSAHNYAMQRNLGVYRFLCALQEEGVTSVGFSWDGLEAAPYLPRVEIGRAVVSPARWSLARSDLAPLDEGSGAARFTAAQKLRARLGLPRRVALVDYDNELPVDLDDALSVDTFVQLVKERPSARLVELHPLDELCVSGPEGRFTNEVVVPFVRAVPRTIERPPPRPVGAARRTFSPGEPWIYSRIYAGPSSVDELLRALAPKIAQLREAGAIDRWFFIRYSDPDFHLRLRLHGDPARLGSEARPLVDEVAARAIREGVASRAEWGTYHRELERYGGEAGIELAERLFHADSDAVLAIVELLEGDDGAEARWKLTLRGMDQLLDDLGFDLAQKRGVLGKQRSSWVREFSFTGAPERQLGDRYRKLRLELEGLLDHAGDEASDLAPGFELFAARSARIAPIARELREAAPRLGLGLDDLASSLLHMHANRLLRSAHRAQELLLYDFLDRLYESREARARKRS